MNFTKDLSDIYFNVSVIYFNHIPKCGGTGFLTNINKVKNQNKIKIIHSIPFHCFNVSNIKYISNGKGYPGFPKIFPKYEYPIKNNLKLTIIRNPFDWLCSYYFNGDKLNMDGSYCHSGWASVNYTHQFKTFKEFITSYCDKDFEWHVPALKKFIYSQLFDKDDKCVINIIIKLEYLKESAIVLKENGIDIGNCTKYNISKNKTKDYKSYYDKEMIQMVTKKCQRELKNFRYDFNGSLDDNPFILNPTIKYNVKKDVVY